MKELHVHVVTGTNQRPHKSAGAAAAQRRGDKCSDDIGGVKRCDWMELNQMIQPISLNSLDFKSGKLLSSVYLPIGGLQ